MEAQIVNAVEKTLELNDFLGETVEDAGVEMMLNDRVVAFGTALWP